MKKIDAFVLTGLMVILLITLGIVDTRRRNSEKQLYKIKPKLDSLSRKLDSLEWLCDSVESEAYHNTVMLNRYQTAYEIFIRRNYEAAREYGEIISEETQ